MITTARTVNGNIPEWVHALFDDDGLPYTGHRISRHFTRDEVRCRCPRACRCETADATLLMMMERLRYELGENPVSPTSWHRCAWYNDLPRAQGGAGGSKLSFHKSGRAVDFTVSTVPVRDVVEYLSTTYPHTAGIGWYVDWFIHLDSRSAKARWKIQRQG